MPPNKTDILQYNNQKNKEIEFYNYFNHLQKFGFVWEYPLLDFKYSTELSKDEKKLIRKMIISKIARKKLFVEESRMWNLERPAAVAASTMSTKIKSFLIGYIW